MKFLVSHVTQHYSVMHEPYMPLMGSYGMQQLTSTLTSAHALLLPRTVPCYVCWWCRY